MISGSVIADMKERTRSGEYKKERASQISNQKNDEMGGPFLKVILRLLETRFSRLGGLL